MSCLCGSQKRSAAPSTINPVNIGNLCFLFGVEGALCQFLDLIPETIKAVLDANKKPDDADEIFFKWVRKFAKTGYNIVIDEATGDIDLTSFCSNPPPPLPDDITFQDVFVFMAEVVPILDRFFKTNDILTGDNTRLIDKVTGFWLFKQWYENCECKKCPDPPDPPDEDLPDGTTTTDRPQFDIPDPCSPCPEGYTRADGSHSGLQQRSRGLTIRDSKTSDMRIAGSNHGFWVYTNTSVTNQLFYSVEIGAVVSTRIVFSDSIYVPLEVSNDDIHSGSQDYVRINSTYRRTERILEFTDINNNNYPPYNDFFGGGSPPPYNASVNQSWNIEVSLDGGRTWSNFSGNNEDYPYSPCSPCLSPPPPPPQEFCDLYPDHPNCVNDNDDDDDDECETENVLVGEFTQCKSLRKPKTVKLFKDVGQADTLETLVIERTNCDSIRGLKVIQYLDCTAPPPPDPCEDVVCDVSTIFADLDAIVANQNVGFGDAEDAYSYLVLPDPQCCKPAYIAEIERYLNQ